MLKVIQVKAAPADLRAIILAGEAKDANLTACLLYLLVASENSAAVEVAAMARAYGVSPHSVTRWVRRLSKLGLLVVRLGGEGLVVVEVRLKKGLGAVEATADELKGLGGSGEHVHDAVVYATGAIPSAALSATASARLGAAFQVFESLPIAPRRELVRSGSLDKIYAMLKAVVANPLFDGLNLGNELKHADAWLVRKAYSDMPKYLMNWLRKEAAKKKPLANANAAPTGKYAAAQASARGAR